jgi:hypothetical protein
MSKSKKQVEKELKKARMSPESLSITEKNRCRGSIINALEHHDLSTNENNIQKAAKFFAEVMPFISDPYDMKWAVTLIEMDIEKYDKKYADTPLWKALNE